MTKKEKTTTPDVRLWTPNHTQQTLEYVGVILGILFVPFLVWLCVSIYHWVNKPADAVVPPTPAQKYTMCQPVLCDVTNSSGVVEKMEGNVKGYTDQYPIIKLVNGTTIYTDCARVESLEVTDCK